MVDLNSRMRTVLLVLYTLIVLLGILWAGAALAGDKITQSNDMNNQTAGNIGGDDSFGLGLSNQLGAASVGDCYSSKQWNAVVFSRQDSTLNKWCAAAWYDANGKHNLAAQMRCLIPEIAKLDYPEGCVAANTIVAPEEVDISDVVNFLAIRQDAVTEPLRADLDKALQTIEELQKRPERPQAQATRIVEQQPRYTEEERQKILSLRIDK